MTLWRSSPETRLAIWVAHRLLPSSWLFARCPCRAAVPAAVLPCTSPPPRPPVPSALSRRRLLTATSAPLFRRQPGPLVALPHLRPLCARVPSLQLSRTACSLYRVSWIAHQHCHVGCRGGARSSCCTFQALRSIALPGPRGSWNSGATSEHRGLSWLRRVFRTGSGESVSRLEPQQEVLSWSRSNGARSSWGPDWSTRSPSPRLLAPGTGRPESHGYNPTVVGAESQNTPYLWRRKGNRPVTDGYHLSGSVEIPSPLTTWPRNVTRLRKRWHFFGLGLSPALANLSNTVFRRFISPWKLFAWTVMSSR